MRSALVNSLVPLLLAACSGDARSGGDSVDSLRIASDLVQCRNEQSALKDQIADLKAEVARLKAANDKTVHTGAIELKPGEERHVEGNLPQEAMTKVIGSNAHTLRVCYEKGLKRNPNLQTVPSVRVRFVIRNTGRVERTDISPHVAREMEACMAAAIGKWKFPVFEGDPVEVETPINLVAHN